MSILVPVLDEEDDLDDALARVARQTFSDFEVIVADGGSRDGTLDIARAWSRRDPRFRLVDNQRRLQSAGLNRALAESRGELLVRLDGHSFIGDDYVERCVGLLDTTGAEVVGGLMRPEPGPTRRSAAIALANRSWWGAGPARFHTGARSGPAETVYLGAFRRDAVAALGGWAEDVGVNEDFELNHRVRSHGGTVWLDVDLEVGYRPRGTIGGLVRQYLRYGRSKAAVVRRHPGSTRVRQLAPMALVPLAACLVPRRTRPAAAAALGAHTALVATGAWREPGQLSDRALGAGAALTMHWSWSAGFWWGAIRPFPPAGDALRPS